MRNFDFPVTKVTSTHIYREDICIYVKIKWETAFHKSCPFLPFVMVGQYIRQEKYIALYIYNIIACCL